MTKPKLTIDGFVTSMNSSAATGELIRLYFDEGLCAREVGERVGRSASAVGRRIERAGRKLRTMAEAARLRDSREFQRVVAAEARSEQPVCQYCGGIRTRVQYRFIGYGELKKEDLPLCSKRCCPICGGKLKLVIRRAKSKPGSKRQATVNGHWVHVSVPRRKCGLKNCRKYFRPPFGSNVHKKKYCCIAHERTAGSQRFNETNPERRRELNKETLRRRNAMLAFAREWYDKGLMRPVNGRVPAPVGRKRDPETARKIDLMAKLAALEGKSLRAMCTQIFPEKKHTPDAAYDSIRHLASKYRGEFNSLKAAYLRP